MGCKAPCFTTGWLSRRGPAEEWLPQGSRGGGTGTEIRLIYSSCSWCLLPEPGCCPSSAVLLAGVLCTGEQEEQNTSCPPFFPHNCLYWRPCSRDPFLPLLGCLGDASSASEQQKAAGMSFYYRDPHLC